MKIRSFGNLYNSISDSIAGFWKKFLELPAVKQTVDFFKNFSLRRIYFKTGLFLASKFKIIKLQDYFKDKLDNFEDVKDSVMFRYIMKELFLYFLVCFAAFFMIFFVNQILLMAETILGKHVPLPSVIRLIWYSLPGVIAQSAPFATLVGFLMCLGRMVTDNEILILRASGQRYKILLKPVLVLGMIISVTSFFVNDYLLPLGTLNYAKYYKKVIASNPAIELESQSVKRLNDSVLVIGDVNKEHVSDLVFFSTDKANNPRMIISKESDIHKSDVEGVLMQLEMDDAFVVMFNKKNKDNYEVLDSKNLKLNIFESSFVIMSGGTSPREMTSWDLKKLINKMKKKSNISDITMNSYNLEYYKKFSIPFGSIFFAILALPLSLIFGRKDGTTLGLIFGVLISLLYWCVTIMGQMFGIRGGLNAFVMMWGPNLLIGLIGILLYLKLIKK